MAARLWFEATAGGATMPGQPTRAWVNVAVLVGLGLIGGGWLLTGVMKSRRENLYLNNQNNLKVIGLAAQNYHDIYLRFAGNGSGVGSGYPTPATDADGSFFYQILPYMEQDLLYRDPTRPNPEPVKAYLERPRGRWGCPNGPVTDFAVNLLALYGEGVVPDGTNTKKTLNLGALQDGSSNTIVVGIKAHHPTDYRTTDPAVDDTFLKLSSGGVSTVGARYTVGSTTTLKALTAPPPAEFLTPAAVIDRDAPRGVRSDLFGSPYPTGTLFVFLDGSVRSVSYKWTADPMTIPPAGWGTPPSTGTFDRVSQLRAALTPNSLENVIFE